MIDFSDIQIPSTFSIKQTLQVIDKGAKQIALVVDELGRLQGTVSDGDVRRALLKNISLDVPVSEIMNPNPAVAHVSQGREAGLRLMRERNLRHIPVVNDQGMLISVWTLQELAQLDKIDTPVVLMAGGLGSRLGELTRDCPKPLLHVGGKPILEIIINNLANAGFYKLWLAVNYKAEMVESYFGDGSEWGVEINYLRENEPLGTAGALSLLSEPLNSHFLVMNGDILTKLPFRTFFESHCDSGKSATMVVKVYEMQVPYGVISIAENKDILDISEKPVQKFRVNAGVYALSPEIFEYIPKGVAFTMPALFKALIANGKSTAVYELNDYWLDIGRIADYQQANEDILDFF